MEELNAEVALKPISNEEVKACLTDYRKATSPFRYIYTCAVCGCRCDVNDATKRLSLPINKLDALKVHTEDIRVIILC